MGVSVKTQKKLMFIPYVNALVPFIWVYNCRKTETDTAVFLQSLLHVFAAAIPLMVVQVVLSKLFPSIGGILACIMSYLAPLAIACCLIRFQERLNSSGDADGK